MVDANLDILIQARDEASRILHGIGGGITSLGNITLMAGAAVATGVVAIGASLVGVASEFESTISGIKAVSGATAEEMKEISALALQLGKDTSFSAKEAAAGIEELIKGGVSLPDVMTGAAAAMLNLAAAGGVTLPDAAEIAANALAMFSLNGSDMAHVADLIAGAANASSLSVSDFKFSLSAAGAIAATTGQSFDDLAQAIAIMGKSGIKGSDAGTSLKTMLMNLQPATKKATAVFKELGIITADGTNKFIDANGKFKSMAEIAGVLQTATEGLTDAQKIQALETMFGSDAIRAAAIMAKEGATGFEAMAEAMGKVTAESVAAERLNNFAGSMEQLKGSLETLAITVGMFLLPYVRKIVDAFLGFVNSIIPLAEQYMPIFIAALQQAGESIMANLQPALNWLAQNGLPLLRAALAFVQEHWDAFKGAIIGVGAALGGAGLMAIISAVIGAISAIGAPILAIIAVAALLGAAWSENWGGIRDILISVWENNLLPALTALYQWLQNDLPIAIQTVSDYWTNTLQPALLAVWQFTNDYLIPILTFIATNTIIGVQAALTTLEWHWTNLLLPALKAVWAFISTFTIPIFQGLMNLGLAVVELGTKVLAGVWTETLLPALKAVHKFIDENVLPIFKSVAKVIGETLGPALSWLKTSIVDPLKGAFDSLAGAVATVKSWLDQVAAAIRSIQLPGWLGGGGGSSGASLNVSGMSAGGANSMTSNVSSMTYSPTYIVQQPPDAGTDYQIMRALAGVA